MTEEQAKTKWCPMVNLGHNSAFGRVMLTDDGGQRKPAQATCIGTECMMWRLQKQDFFHEGACPPEATQGYCGLAGKP